MKKSNELLPCPFCGNKDIKSIDNSSYLSSGGARVQWKISCNHCCLDMFGGEGKIKTIERWNFRQSPPERTINREKLARELFLISRTVNNVYVGQKWEAWNKCADVRKHFYKIADAIISKENELWEEKK